MSKVRYVLSILDPSSWSLPITIGVFLVAALVIGFVGKQMATIADELADVTGLGEALMGALFLGAATSLPGIITSVTAATRGLPELAISNAVGGIAAQTVFLVVADIFHRDANLEHAAASPANILQGILLVVLLAMPLIARSLPEYTLFEIHPVSVIMIAAYIYGLRMAQDMRKNPMWKPQQTDETDREESDADDDVERNLGAMWGKFALYAAIVGVAGWMTARSGENLIGFTGLSQTVVGALFTAVATSLPELVTSVAAVRAGALTLAVSGIIGGNAFDTLFISVADMAYRDGSIYHVANQQQVFLIALGILLTGILLLGLFRRQEKGFANIGFESISILVVYVLAMGALFIGG